ncbi:MAG: ABC transporter transmembrane domain-containing protein [Gammaproteobacteria bacterium]|jgi:ATP-binding cassette subfamily B protein|nr:ABC transporter transmembrane domain-containing protein [Gammaproteobacteria bacterium]MDP6616717.1 ABC transporter transmembrane domain-containing protein [Gammaproteobacteria bacterium]MDP6695218.1 ABC transporter transmembrane domain-containing protein [Gammaproteobacteria bacterium]MDP7041190.1 ABC transporter transmembrane domain-containing protein [Gammaproteobacteria bacterium]
MPPHDQKEWRPKGTSLKPLRAIIPFISPYAGTLVVAIIVLLAASAATGSLPLAARYLIDNGITTGDAEMIDFYFMVVFGVILAISILSAARLYLITWLGERVVADIRDKVYAHVIRQDPAFFEVTQTGEVLSRLTTDTTLVQSISGVGISIALRSTVMLFISIAGVLYTSPRLTMMILLLVPAVILPVLWIARKVRKLSRTAQDRVADSSGMANETLNAIQTVQAFTLESLQSKRFGTAVEDAFLAAIRRIRVRFVMSFGTMFLLFGAITLVLWTGTREVLAGDMLPGELAQFVIFTVLLGSSGAMLSEMWGEVQRAAGAMERLIELLEAEPNIRTPDNPVPMPDIGEGRIAFEGVNFCYPSRPDTRAIDDFTLDIEPGETIAFVGPSGAGKSTTFQLLLRFYDPQSGTIRIDGVDIAAADPQEVRTRIGVVPQETMIFGTSALENIRYGRPDATDAEVRAAAEAAEADEFIDKLPDGIDTFLGEKGMRLSGGQRQRVAIARAILKNPPILLLDEATSSLDAESERLVQEALENLMQNRTTIIIAHRLATVLKAQRIVVMDEGRIQDIGSHAELVQKNPLYARLAELQFRSAEEDALSIQSHTRPPDLKLAP